MDELDLDELHQNVTSMMDGKKSKAAKRSVAPRKDSVVTVPSRPSTPAEPVTSEPEQDDTIKVTVKRPMPKVNGRRGVAMDIISNQTPPKVAPPSAKPKREAPSLQPTKPVTPEPPKPVESNPEMPHPRSTGLPVTPAQAEPSDDVLASLNMQVDSGVPKTPAPEPPKPADTEVWPDPLDVHGFTDNEPAKESESEPVPEPIPEPTIASEPEPPVPVEPASSPFLTTKVEKRPLGAFTDQTPPKEEAMPAPKEPISPAPVETPPAPEETQSSKPEANPAEPGDSSMEELRQMAIPQQYKTATTEASTDARPVFDTHEYHTPIEAHAASLHHKSHLGWIIVAVLTLVLIGLAAAGYFMITGNMDITRIF